MYSVLEIFLYFNHNTFCNKTKEINLATAANLCKKLFFFSNLKLSFPFLSLSLLASPSVISFTFKIIKYDFNKIKKVDKTLSNAKLVV